MSPAPMLSRDVVMNSESGTRGGGGERLGGGEGGGEGGGGGEGSGEGGGGGGHGLTRADDPAKNMLAA